MTFKMDCIKTMRFWLLCWVGFVLCYGMSIKYNFYTQQWQHVIYLTQLFVDILIGYYGLATFRNRSIPAEKKFYFIIFLSLIPGLFTNEIYNLIIILPGVSSITTGTDLYWSISYLLFIIIQIFGWLYLLRHYSNNAADFQRKSIIVLYAQPIIILLLSFVAIILLGSDVFSRMNLLGVINSILEALLFILVSACLSRTKNNSLVTLESGFLLLIAFNLMHRFSYMTGHYTKIFDAAWILALIMIIFGLAKAYVNKSEEIAFFPAHSIHSITSAIFVSFAIFLFTLFILVGFTISFSEIGKIGGSNTIVPQNIPVILIFSYLLTLLISRVVADFITEPLNYLHQKINLVYENKYENSVHADKVVDVFEINELEKFTLHTLKQLQVANHVKANFLMNMSHDFRTPASGIYQMARYVHKKLEDPKLSSYMKLVVGSSGQLLNLLDDVLDYSRLESNKWRLIFEKFDIAAVIRDVVLCLSAKAKEKLLEVSYIFCTEPFYYFGDRLAINRVILNLVSNAIKFTDKGTISIKLDKQVNDHQSCIIIEVADTGIGILSKDHQAIFEPFNRVSSVENSKYPGIGLGLSNANLVAKKLGGKITVTSEINVGSIFSVYLPLQNKIDENSL